MRTSIVREIRHRPNSAPDFRSTATVPGQDVVIEDEDKITKLRDAFLPRHLARFFFFDAERSQSIQLNQQEIVEGISRVLGLWTYGELEDDLRSLVTAKIPKLFGSGSEAEKKLNAITAEVQRSEHDLTALRKEREEVSFQISDLEASLTTLDDELKSVGAIDPEQIKEAQRRKEELTKQEGELLASLTRAWETAMPTALLGDFRCALSDYLLSEEARRDWEGRKRSVEPRIPTVREQIFSSPPPEHVLSESTREFYVRRLVEALQGLFDPPPDGMSKSVFVCERTEVSAQIRGRLMSPLGDVSDLAATVAKLDTGRAELRDLNQQIARLSPDDETQRRANDLREKRGKTLSELEALNRRLREVEAEVSALTTKVAELRGQETDQKKIVDKIEKGRSLTSLAHRYREAVGKIRAQAAVQLREQISSLVGELWVEITERGLEFSGMDFDDKWNCKLRQRNGSSIPWDLANNSAGQKQVRLLAFTEALRRLARLAPPLVVDTPLGRLDKEVRRAVLEHLYLSGHQSIILTTNAEIDPDGEQFERIKDRLARVYTLNPDGNPESSDYTVRVTDDYFGRSI